MGFFSERNRRAEFASQLRVSAADRRRPLQREVADESHFHFERVRGLHFEQNHRARFLHRNE